MVRVGIVGILSVLWDFIGCALAVYEHAPPFAVAFLGLAVWSAVITARSMVDNASPTHGIRNAPRRGGCSG
jgi:hypothetical protein